MSWHDPARIDEPDEERALREELGTLLGVKPPRFFDAEPTPRMIALAEDLRREALRRRHTTRQRPVWMLLAAGLPLALALTAAGTWSFQQKRKAETLAAQNELLKLEIDKQVKASNLERVREQTRQLEIASNLPRVPAPELRVPIRKTTPGDLVIPVDRPVIQPPPVQMVKNPGE